MGRSETEAKMAGIVAENGMLVTDGMIARWEDALECDEWPTGWVNVGEIVDGRLPKAAPETTTLSIKVPAAMKKALEREAEAEGKSTGAYARGILANGLMAIANNNRTVLAPRDFDAVVEALDGPSDPRFDASMATPLKWEADELY